VSGLDVGRDALTILRKDLRTELRSKEIVLTMGFFGFLVVLISAFSFFRGDAPITAVAAGTLWVAIAFSGTLGLGRAFDRERDGDCIKALLLSPVSRASIYLGKLAGIVVFMSVVEVVVVPAVALFFSLQLDATRLGWLVAVIALGTLGYAIVGTLLAASLLRAQSKDVLLAIVLYPVVIPVIIGGVKATSAILAPEILMGELRIWLNVLMVFDLVFLIASLWIFEPLILD
jgi:heme exporter protein B